MPLVGEHTLRIAGISQCKADRAGNICKVLTETGPTKEAGQQSCQYLGGVAAHGATLHSSVRIMAQVPGLWLSWLSDLSPFSGENCHFLSGPWGINQATQPDGILPYCPSWLCRAVFWWQRPIWPHWFYLISSDVVAFIVDPSGTICPSVFWLPAARLSGAVSLSSRRVARRSEPSEEEALPGAEGCQRAARCGTLWRLLDRSIPKTLPPRESCRNFFFF